MLALDIQNLHRVFRYVFPLKSGMSSPLSWGLGAARGRNLPTHDKWYQSEPWSMLSGTNLQDTMASKSYGDNCLDPRIHGDFHFCNVWSCRGDLKECTAIASVRWLEMLAFGCRCIAEHTWLMVEGNALTVFFIIFFSFTNLGLLQ